MGVVSPIVCTDGTNKCVFALDISELPRPPSWLRIKGPVISIMQFISDICEGSGYDFFIDYDRMPSTTASSPSKYSGIIKLKTVSRRTQPQKNKILSFIQDYITKGYPLTNYSYGQEFNDSTTRTMYIGGKQRRLFQYKSLRFTWKQHSMIYDPYANNGGGSFALCDVGGNKNFFRQPSPYSYRARTIQKGNHISLIDKNNAPNTSPLNFPSQGFTQNGFGDPGSDPHHRPVRDGNYYTPIFYPDNLNSSFSIPLYYDMICPYFGKHYDGSIRRVFYDRQMGQLQILFKIQDLIIAGNTLPYVDELTQNPPTKYFVVLENEIRAAGAGFESWLSYCFDNGFYTDIERLTYRALNRKYGNAAEFDIGSVHKGMIDSIKNGNLKDVSSGGQFGYDNMIAYGDEIYSTLNSIYKIFSNIANEFYGKSYMVSVPPLKSYRDYKKTNIIVGYAMNDAGGQDTSKPIYATEGTNKLYTDLEISTEGAWEEPGNVIDDAIIVGSSPSYALTNEQNMIQPILGFNTSSFLDSKFVSYWNKYFNGTLPLGNPSFYNIASLFIGSFNILNAVRYPITTEIDPAEFISINRPGARTDAHGSAAYNSQKSYFKCSANDTFEGLIDTENNNTLYVKAIVNLSSPVNMTTSRANGYNLKSVMLQDTYLRLMEKFGRGEIGIPQFAKKTGAASIIANLISNEDSKARTFYRSETTIGGLLPKLSLTDDFAGVVGDSNKLTKIVSAIHLMYVKSLSSDALDPIFPLSSNQTASAYDNAQINPKAAIPTFAALPLKYNQYTYGPWIDYPSFTGMAIFPEYNNINNAANRIENLIGGVKVEVDESLVPWEYGGMSVLDTNIAEKLNEDINYQQELENATVELPIFPNYRLGHILGNNGPLLTNINVQIGANGVTTSLSFRTYTKKLGLFNKENAERMKQISLESIKRNREINNKYLDLSKRIRDGNPGSSTSVSDYSNDSIPKVFRWSPVEIIVGGASIAQPKNSDLQKYSDIKYSPSWHINPLPNASQNADTGKAVKQFSKITIQDFRETPRELKDNYESKSIMSLDGIMSPVSLFPTAHGGTFHVTKYDTTLCPMCKGSKRYEYNALSQVTTFQGSDGINNSKTTTTLVCDFCEVKDPNSRKKTAFGYEPDPPFILASDSDVEVLRNLARTSLSVPRPVINYSTLNPLLLPNGEFSNDNKQMGDSSAFMIDSVAYGVIPPSKSREGLRSLMSTDIGGVYSHIDKKYSKKINQQVSNNHRFFALRGPLMVHGWGYDTEGYPVPNAADEPLLNSNGDFNRDANGTIIKKGDTLVGGRIVPEQFAKSGTFYGGWGQLPSSWPVGPIDLRWDREAKVWTVGGNNYKPVFVVLEEDLTDIQPVRGTLLSNNINNAPLSSTTRKLVFVKDNKGLTAPRGAKVFCRYSAQNGFYEPIYASNLITSGIIRGAGIALISKAYSIPAGISTSDQKNTDSYQTSFQNPLNFSVTNNSPGLFCYINGSWVLQAVN